MCSKENKMHRYISFFVTLFMLATICTVPTSANATEYRNDHIQAQAISSTDGTVVFKNINLLQSGQPLIATTYDPNGETVIWQLEVSPDSTRSSRRAKIHRTTVTDHASFWVTVTNNRVTAADSPYVAMLPPFIPSEVTLTHNSTTAKMTWIYSTTAGGGGMLYLQCAVVGYDNICSSRYQ